MSAIPFTKMHGLGNDYIYVDCFAHDLADHDLPKLARTMADRNFGIGGDGLILLLPPTTPAADVRMRMFNADGSESEMCGNGIRCVCKLAYDHCSSNVNPMRIEIGAGVLALRYTLNDDGAVDQVTVDMGAPVLDPVQIPVALPRPHHDPIIDFPLDTCIPIGPQQQWMSNCGLDLCMTCVSMGNPHLVIFCRHVGNVPLGDVGPFLEHQPIFPNRINVHFVEVNARDDVTMRTWERGSGITLACGTGAAAVCVAGAITERTNRAITAHLPGGNLTLDWDLQTGHVYKTGPATTVFTGIWQPAATSLPLVSARG